jgi:hypothetical protein
VCGVLACCVRDSLLMGLWVLWLDSYFILIIKYFYLVLSPFQIVDRLDFSKFVDIIIHIDIVHV